MNMRGKLNFINRVAGRRRRVVFLVACAGIILHFAGPVRSNIANGPTARMTSAGEDFARFSHTSDNHSRQSCGACHVRKDNSPMPGFPGHKACTNCHLAQFVTPAVPMCNICHSSLSGGNPPLRQFPSKFKESFNAKFDHVQHNSGNARPSSGCAACHNASLRRGTAMTIPVGISTHTNCYQCHTPGKTTSSGRDIGGCGTCHASATYRRTPTTTVAFNANFKHNAHGARQRLDCSDCHSLKAGLSQSRQVTSPRTAQHFPSAREFSCATCHNDRRSFGEAKYDNCARCHAGTTFKFKGMS